MRCKWEKTKLGGIVVFNPKLSLPKGSLAKKVAMEHLLPFSKYITKFELSSYAGGAKFMNGDTLLARITPCLENGKTSQVTMLDEDEIGFGSTEFIVLRAKDGISDKDFIYYLSISPQFRDYAIKSMVGSSGRQRVQQDVLENMYIDCPSISEQKAIAAVLSALDDKIEVNNRINKNLEAQAQAIFSEWILNNYNNPIGALSDIADINPHRKLSKGVRAKYIEMSNLTSASSFPVDWEEKAYNGGVKFQNGDTLLARITPCLENGKGAYVNFLEDGEIGFGSTEYIVITGKPGVCNELFYFLIRHPEFRAFAAQSMTGSSGRQRASAEAISKYTIPIPTKEVLKRFEKVAATIMMSNRARSFENRALAAIRDTLLPKLMSGEIRVPLEV